VGIGSDEGLKHDSSIHCDELVSLPKTVLTDYVGSLSRQKLDELTPTPSPAVSPTPQPEPAAS
jgi:mRNA-degrading endonuclease toxin of MazEF toxin-antitoxin module